MVARSSLHRSVPMDANHDTRTHTQHARLQVAERYAQLVGQQGEELLLLRTAEQEAVRARERNEELEGSGKCGCVGGCEWGGG